MSEPTGPEKTRFRNTVAWKRFRESMLDASGYQCQCCGMKYGKIRRHILNVHHRDPENYQDLRPDKFRVLCVTCHEFIEFMIKRILGKTFRNYELFPVVYLGVRNFLAVQAVRKGDNFLDQGKTHVIKEE